MAFHRGSSTSQNVPGSLVVPGIFSERCFLVCLAVFFSKGVLIMALLPVVTCAQMLGIHPKTLHHWLSAARLPVVTHPTDARIKCLTEHHLKAGRPASRSCTVATG